MGRELRDKLPKVEIRGKMTEPQWQQLLKERDARAKLRQKEHADKTRAAKFSDIEEGDQILLRQTRENKLLPNYEPDPYTVIQKDGNAVILEDANGNNKMRNIAHMKKFVTPEPAAAEGPAVPAQVEESRPNASLPVTVVQDPPPNPLSGSSVVSRPARSRRPPAWLDEYVTT